MSLPLPSETKAEFLSESAYDALREGLPLVVRLLRSPSSVSELAKEWPDEVRLRRILGRLERSGIVRKEGERYVASAGVVQSRRQEGMVTAVSELCFPTLVRLFQDPRSGLLMQLDLSLSEEEQRALRQGPVEELIGELYRLSEEPAPRSEALRVIVFGTANPPRMEDPVDRTFEILRRTARDRTIAGMRERAVITVTDGHFASFERAAGALRRFANRMQDSVAEPSSATYSLVLGLSAQPLADGVNL